MLQVGSPGLRSVFPEAGIRRSAWGSCRSGLLVVAVAMRVPIAGTIIGPPWPWHDHHWWRIDICSWRSDDSRFSGNDDAAGRGCQDKKHEEKGFHCGVPDGHTLSTKQPPICSPRPVARCFRPGLLAVRASVNRTSSRNRGCVLSDRISEQTASRRTAQAMLPGTQEQRRIAALSTFWRSVFVPSFYTREPSKLAHLLNALCILGTVCLRQRFCHAGCVSISKS